MQVSASRFFISSCVVYSGRGYKQHLSQEILDKSGVLQREHNYANRENYVESKRLFVKEVSLYMKKKLRADWMVVESGTGIIYATYDNHILCRDEYGLPFSFCF